MPPQTRRSLDGLLAIGPHRLDAQLRSLLAYAARTGHRLEVVWTLLPGEDAATAAPRSGFPVVAFDDEIAGFTAEEYEDGPRGADERDDAVTDWHVAHRVPQPKRPTMHLPVYGHAGRGETAADAVLSIGSGSLDLQLARIEAYALRSGLRVRGVYVATGPDYLRAMLRDFRASGRARGTGRTLIVDPQGEVEVQA